MCIHRPPSWVLHDAPSSGMSLIGCEESADEASPKELGDTRDTCSARSRDGHAGVRACLLVLEVGTPEFSNQDESPRFIVRFISRVDPAGLILTVSFVSGGCWSSRSARETKKIWMPNIKQKRITDNITNTKFCCGRVQVNIFTVR